MPLALLLCVQVKPRASGIDHLLRQVLMLQAKNEAGPVLEVGPLLYVHHHWAEAMELWNHGIAESQIIEDTQVSLLCEPLPPLLSFLVISRSWSALGASCSSAEENQPGSAEAKP